MHASCFTKQKVGEKMSDQRIDNKRADILQLVMTFGVIVLISVLSQYLFVRLDLTAEKRYTLSESTKTMLEELDDIVYFKVYLEGDFPQGAGGFKRLQEETKIILDEFRVYAGDNIQYEFINPSENPVKKDRDAFHRQLIEKGVRQFNLEVPAEDGGGMSTMQIFPGALATYRGKEVALELLSTRSGTTPEQQLNNSVSGLEYEITNAIRKLKIVMKPKIGIVQGHYELDSLYLNQFTKALREYYDVEYVDLKGNLNAFRDTVQNAEQIRNKYTALVIARPDTMYSQQDLFVLDQYVMYGGKVMWMVDPVYINQDTMALTGQTMGMPNQLGIEELLFRYGARLNTTLVQDLYCSPIGINVAPPGAPAQVERRPWLFYPTILPEEKHPIVKNLDAIRFTYLSTIDTVETSANVKKTILMTTSGSSRAVTTPTRITLALTRIQPDRRQFNKPRQPVAVLLEGQFDSYWKNKYLPDEFKQNKLIGFKDKSPATQMIVISDGEVAANDIRQGQPMVLGYDRYSGYTYANKPFLLNCVNYLCGDKELLAIRSREVMLRLLDKNKIKERRMRWQLVNTLAPVAFILSFGFLFHFVRKNKYGISGKWDVLLPAAGLLIYLVATFQLQIKTTWITALLIAVYAAAVAYSYRFRKRHLKKM